MTILYCASGLGEPISFPHHEVATGVLFEPPYTGGTLPESVLLFDPALEDAPSSEAELFNRFRKIPTGAVESADLTIIRGSGPNFIERVRRNTSLRSYLDVLGTAGAVLVSHYGGEQGGPRLFFLDGRSDSPANDAAKLLREIEITGLMRQCGSVLNAGANAHFLLPSGAASKTFIRIADSLRYMPAVRRLADWIVPYISPSTVVISDTGTLLPLLLQIKLVALDTLKFQIPIGSISSYPSDDSQFLAEINDFSYRFPGYDVLFVISVNSSGKLLTRMKWAIESKLITGHIVIVCDTEPSLPQTGVEVLAKLPLSRWTPEDSPDLPGPGQYAIAVDPSSFERIARPIVVQRRLLPQEANKDSAFWEIADRTKAIHFHYTTPYRANFNGANRHHPIYLDVSLMFLDEEFAAECINKIHQLPSPTVVLIPKHSGSQAVRNLMLQALESTDADINWADRVLVISDIDEAETLLANLTADEWVMVADDALVTGETIIHWRRKIQKIANRRGRWINTCGFVAVARVSSPEVLSRAVNEFRDNSLVSHLRWGFSPIMPKPVDELLMSEEGQSCPWCVEIFKLQTFGSQLEGAAKAFADFRLDHLRYGNVTECFLLAGDPSVQMDYDKVVGSLFGELSPTGAFAAAACATYRFTETMLPVWSRGTLEVLDIGHFLDSYMEDPLHAGMLRMVPSTRSRHPATDYLTNQALASDFSDYAPVAVCEIGWAAVSGKLAVGPTLQLLEQKSDQEHPAIAFVLQMMRLSLLSQS